MGLELRFSFKVCASISVCPDRMTSECVKLLYSRGGNVVELAFSGEHAAAWAAACAGDEIGNKLFDLLESFRGATAAECLAQPAGQSTPGLLAADNLSASARSGQQTKASPSGSSMAERQAASEARQSLPRERRRSDPDEEPATGTGAPRGGSVAGAWARVDAARMERAHEAGMQAARKLAGGIKAVPKTPPPVGGELRPRWYVVLRALQPEAEGIYRRWRTSHGLPGAAQAVMVGDAPGAETVFHGFPSMAEARAYAAAAKVEWEELRQW